MVRIISMSSIPGVRSLPCCPDIDGADLRHAFDREPEFDPDLEDRLRQIREYRRQEKLRLLEMDYIDPADDPWEPPDVFGDML